MRFIDSMDTTRQIEPVKPCADGKNTECKVYFNGIFVGRAPVPSALIGPAPGSREARTGFVEAGW